MVTKSFWKKLWVMGAALALVLGSNDTAAAVTLNSAARSELLRIMHNTPLAIWQNGDSGVISLQINPTSGWLAAKSSNAVFFQAGSISNALILANSKIDMANQTNSTRRVTFLSYPFISHMPEMDALTDGVVQLGPGLTFSKLKNPPSEAGNEKIPKREEQEKKDQEEQDKLYSRYTINDIEQTIYSIWSEIGTISKMGRVEYITLLNNKIDAIGRLRGALNYMRRNYISKHQEIPKKIGILEAQLDILAPQISSEMYKTLFQ
ncbi:hypothetical protein [Azotosporobacter soli]|uniref:hypothetical protein n=1 Tax=Azotosporobacter soli TaxID=3055040 RepID=UPI0031FE5E2E